MRRIPPWMWLQELLIARRLMLLNPIQDLKLNPELRKKDGSIYFTDSGNYIFDLKLGEINDPAKLNESLKQITGVVETGLFINVVDILIVGENNSATILSR